MNIIRKYYDEHAEGEWKRLLHDPYRRLEFIVTMHFLDKYLPKKGVILDAGGGPGRYSVELAKKGYDVALFDLSAKCLEVAKKQIARAHVENRIKVVEGSITDMSTFNGEQFDAILCLGPFSHLVDKRQIEKAADETVRVAKTGAPLFISVISLYGVFRTVLQRLRHELTDPSRAKLFTHGIHRWHKPSHKGEHDFPDAYFWHPKDLKELFENKGVKTLQMATLEGLSSHLQGATNRLYRDKEKWAKWKELILKTCADPVLLGMGEHFLYIGQKSNKQL
jgi:2-polyprenyl-3-methyl-5-hydroxy-6-metoxy-1,4-benzoquinol methylase